MSTKMFVSVVPLGLYGKNDRLVDVEEHSIDFEHTIDHDDLADLIGKTVVQSINRCRDRSVDVTEVRFSVIIQPTR